MKKLFLFILTCVLSASIWAADTSITENFTNLPKVNTGTAAPLGTANGYDFTGDACAWHLTFVRWAGSNDWITVNSENLPAMWLSKNSTTHAEMATTDWEGGIKAVSFRWAQFGGESGNTLRLQVAAGSIVDDSSISRSGSSANKADGGEVYNHDFECKTNAQLVISNISTKGGNNDCRILVNELKITPYLLYTQKKVFISPAQTGYINAGLVDNTDGVGSVTYTIHDKDAVTQNVADINPSTGAITPKAIGKAVVTAMWENVTTTYELTVAYTAVETFDTKDGSTTNTYMSAVTTKECQQASWTFLSGGILKNLGDMGADNYAAIIRAKKSSESVYPYIQSSSIEGGIKNLQFTWNSNGNETGGTWNVKVYINDNILDAITGAGAPKAAAPFNSYSSGELNIKDNYVIKLVNESPYSGAGNSMRFVFDNLKITPYLLYTTKAVALDTRYMTSYINTDLVDNTAIEPGTAILYSISPIGSATGATINEATGEVTATTSAQGDFTITATWGEISTSYVLSVTSRNETEAWFKETDPIRIGLDGTVPARTLEYTPAYEGGSNDITYSSNNTAVATVNPSTGAVTLAGGVGQAIITAILAQTENYKSAEASYSICVTDNNTARIESFKGAAQPMKSNASSWAGDLFQWTAGPCVRRGENDTIWSEENQGTLMGINKNGQGYLQSELVVEGGIKYMSFYCKQWATENMADLKMRLGVYADDNLLTAFEYAPSGATTHEKFLVGANGITKNSVLKIVNESYTGEEYDPEKVLKITDNSNYARFILDNIHITPYLLFTTKEVNLDMRDNPANNTYKNDDLINYTGVAPFYTISPSDNVNINNTEENRGLVTAGENAQGDYTITASWGDVSTSYVLHIISRTPTTASFDESEQFMVLGADVPENVLNKTEGYDGDITYTSSNTAVADFVNGVLTINGVGQTKVTAILPLTTDFTETTASYLLTVSYANFESFDQNTTTSTYAKPEEHAMGDQCNWYAYIGGVKKPDYFTSNAITTRAQRSTETKQGYVKSDVLHGGISALAFNYSMMYADNDIEKWDIHVYVNDRLLGQLTNETGEPLEGVNGRTIKPMPVFKIEGINEPGNFVIRFENHSTVKEGVSYTEGNKGRFAIDNISWTSYDAPIALSENADNSTVLAVNAGSEQDVTIDRSVLLANEWNTICLPYAISPNDLYPIDKGIQQMTDAYLSADGQELTVVFEPFNGNELEAGKPYLVKPTSDVVIGGAENVTLVAEPQSVTFGPMTMHGTFSPFFMKAGDKNTFFVGRKDNTGRNLFYPSVDSYLKGFRAYFTLNLEEGQPAPQRARFVVNQEAVATGIDNVQNDNAQGTKVLRDGQLLIIRDGRTYNAQGARVQ